MPNAKMNVTHLLDHGWSAAPDAALKTTVVLEDAEPTPLPGEASVRLMNVAKAVSVTKSSDLKLAKAVVAAKTPQQFATLMIDARYQTLDGARGFLGAATTAVTVCPDGVGYFRHHKGGSIYWSPGTGAHEVHGAIRAKWAALGWEKSFLGYPRTDETVGRDPKAEGRYNHFQGGSIYWHPQTGAFEVHGAIRAKYFELGAEASILGYPTTDETATPDKIGRFNHFQRGSIYWTPSTWAHEVHGLIRNFWAQHGWERNPDLGYPLTDELVPHRGVGHTPAPPLRKPLADLPADVLRLPDETPPPTLKVVTAAQPAPSTVVKRKTAASTRTAALTAVRPATVKLGTTDVLVAKPVVVLNPSILIVDRRGRSQDRFSDFENGVLFWRRATNAVTKLAPRAKAPNGAKMAWTAAEVAALVNVRIRQALGAFPGANPAAATFAGVTGYSWDGAGVHNRNHRLRVNLVGRRRSGASFVAAVATVEVRAEISFDPVDREIVGYLTGWSLVASQGDFHGGGDLRRVLHQRLDPSLWKQFLVTKVPATKNDPIAVLSVKTLPDGRVAVYFEP
jgi:hypothetical protein